MGLFGAIIRTTVNVVTLPVAVLKDALTLGNVAEAAEELTFYNTALSAQLTMDGEPTGLIAVNAAHVDALKAALTAYRAWGVNVFEEER